MKECFKCKKSKPLNHFYKHQGMKDGRVNKCKECNKLDVRKNRYKNIEYYRKYDRDRGNRLPDNYEKEYRARFPDKYKAHTMVSNAVRDGKMTRPNYCQGCGAECRPDGHHENYLKPLDVVWLCKPCHHFAHASREFIEEYHVLT